MEGKIKNKLIIKKYHTLALCTQYFGEIKLKKRGVEKNRENIYPSMDASYFYFPPLWLPLVSTGNFKR